MFHQQQEPSFNNFININRGIIRDIADIADKKVHNTGISEAYT